MKWISEYSSFVTKVDPDLREEIKCVLDELTDKDLNFGSCHVTSFKGKILVTIFKIPYYPGVTYFKLDEVHTEVIRIIRIMESWGFHLDVEVRHDLSIRFVGSSEDRLRRLALNSNYDFRKKCSDPGNWDDVILDCEVYGIDMLFSD